MEWGEGRQPESHVLGEQEKGVMTKLSLHYSSQCQAAPSSDLFGEGQSMCLQDLSAAPNLKR